MPKGGIRANNGPAPAEHSQAKDRAAARIAKGLPPKTTKATVIDDGEWLTLPREGRTGNPPAWPLSKASARESDLWRRLWKRPVALGWERVGSEHQVAMYVRTLVRAEDRESPIGLSNLVRLQQDGLGLTSIGLRMLKWRIGQASKMAPADVPSSPQRPVAGVPPKMRLVRDMEGAS